MVWVPQLHFSFQGDSYHAVKLHFYPVAMLDFD